MQPAVPAPRRNGRARGNATQEPPGRDPGFPGPSAIFPGSDAPEERSARNNRSMSQQPSSEVPVQPAAQPSVGSLAAHRPHATPASHGVGFSTAADLDPDLDADADAYEPDRDGDELPQGRFLDRERSWLAFNERVLELAEDPNTPILERANFLAIFASNLDEFFMAAVAKRRIATGVATRSASGLQPREVLDLIWTRSRAHGPARRLLPAGHRPGPVRRGHPADPLAGPDREGAGPPVHLLPAARLPGPDPAGRRPRAPLPVHLRALPQPRRRRPQPGQRPPPLRPGQGPAAADPLPGGLAPAVRAHRGHHRGAPGGAVPGHGGAGAPHVPRHQERGPGGRGGRRGEPPPGPGEGAHAPPVRPAGAPGGRGVHRPVRPGPAGPRAEGVRRGGLPAARTARPDRALRHRLAGPAGAEVPQVHRGHPPGPGRGGVRLGARHLRRPARARRPAPPPVRLVLHLRPGVPGAGGGRPRRTGHQADAVPHLRRLPDSGRPHRRRRVRQAGPRPRRDQGPLRRAGQHQVGPQAGGKASSATSSTASSG